MSNIVLVCGGRDYKGDVSILDDLPLTPDIVIHGNARGADKRAAAHFKARGIHCAAVDALWTWYDLNAGYRRNAAMLLLRPTYCVAFPGGKGTAMMVELCEQAKIPVWKPYG